MKKSKGGIFAATLLLLAGCATPVQMVPMGGSREDGTIDMAFEYGLFEKPEINKDQAQASATQTCGGWGYSGAQPFGSYQQRCIAMTNSGCMRFQVTVRYQCTGAPAIRN